MELTETHYYDGKLKDYAERLFHGIEKGSQTFEQVCRDFQEWAQKVNAPQAKITLEFLLKEKGHNLDPTDNLNAEDLLILIWEKIKGSPEDYSYIFEQLGDITTSGPCLMGRSKRLFQVFIALYD